MKKAIYVFCVVLGLLGGFAFGALNASAQEASLDEVKSLPGYKSYTTLSSFTAHLKGDPALYKALASNRTLSEKIMGSTSLQRQLLTDIKKADNSQQVISSYLDEFKNTGDLTGTAFSQRENSYKQRLEEQRQKRKELNRQAITGDDDSSNQRGSRRLGGNVNGNANLAAQRAIKKAQREALAAQNQAEAAIAAAELSMNGQGNAALGEQALLQVERTEKVLTALDDHPEARAAFLADGALQQKIIDDEISLQDALAKLGVEVDVPAPEDDTIFGDGFEEPQSDKGLVHVSGNHYKLNGIDVWDMNYIPDPTEMELDANGWPKYLNVPADCPAPRENTEYYHRAFYNYDGGGDPDSPYYKRGKHSLGDMGAHLTTYFHMGTLWFYTSLQVGDPQKGIKSKETAYPFISPAQPGQNFQAKIVSLNWAGRGEVQSISYCPGDFEGVTPAGKDPLPEGCKGGIHYVKAANGNEITFGPKAVNTAVRHFGDDAYGIDCEVQPGKRYFNNFRSYREHKALVEEKPITELEKSGQRTHSGRISERGDFGRFSPPYANACVDGKDAKDIALPINYPNQRWSDAETSHVACGRTTPVMNGCSNAGSNIVCYDVTGQLPPAEFIQSCTAGTKSWIKGYGKKALSTFVCEDRNASSQIPVCAAHREGEVRKQVYRTTRGYKVKHQYQCQYDKELGMYDWHLIMFDSRERGRSGRLSGSTVSPPDGQATFNPPAHKDTCAWDGKEYPLGTKMVQDISNRNINKRMGKHTFVCMQRAPEPALPRFTHVDLKVSPEAPMSLFSPNGDPSYVVTFEDPPAGYVQDFAPEGPKPLGQDETGEEDFSDKPKVDFSHNMPASGASCSTLDNVGHNHGWTGNLYNRQKVSCKSSCAASAIASDHPDHHERIRCNNGQYEKCRLINDQTDIDCKNVRIQTGGGNRLELCPGPVPPAGCPTSGIDPASYRTSSNVSDKGYGGVNVTLRSQPVFANNAYASCSQMACRSCLTTDNQAMPHGWSGSLFPTNNVSCESCPSARSCSCDDGVFEGACTDKRFGTSLEKWLHRPLFPQWQEETIREFYTSCSAQRSSCEWQPDGTTTTNGNILMHMIGGGVDNCEGETTPTGTCSGRSSTCVVPTGSSTLERFICK